MQSKLPSCNVVLTVTVTVTAAAAAAAVVTVTGNKQLIGLVVLLLTNDNAFHGSTSSNELIITGYKTTPVQVSNILVTPRTDVAKTGGNR